MLNPLLYAIALLPLAYGITRSKPLWQLYLSVSLGWGLAATLAAITLAQLNRGNWRWLISNNFPQGTAYNDTYFIIPAIDPPALAFIALIFAGLSAVVRLATQRGWRPTIFDLTLFYTLVVAVIVSPLLLSWASTYFMPQRYLDYSDYLVALRRISAIGRSVILSCLAIILIRVIKGARQAKHP